MILSLLVCSTLLFWGCGKGGMPNGNSAVASSTDFVDVYTEDEEEWTRRACSDDRLGRGGGSGRGGMRFHDGNGYGYII
jgi:hypothetical protein